MQKYIATFMSAHGLVEIKEVLSYQIMNGRDTARIIGILGSSPETPTGFLAYTEDIRLRLV